MPELTQSKVIDIPETFTGTKRKLIGRDVVEFIKKRTRSGLDVSNNFFSGYSKEYEKSGKVDLTLSNQMLNNLKLLSHGRGFIRIGFDIGSANDKASWNQNPQGQKSGSPSRKFVGISTIDLTRILNRHK